MVRIYVHTGYLSHKNGASSPLSQFCDLAKMLGTHPAWGSHYFDDSIEVSDDTAPLVEQILTESHFIYRVHGRDATWTNVRAGNQACAVNS